MSRMGLAATVIFATIVPALGMGSASAQGSDETGSETVSDDGYVGAPGGAAEVLPADYAAPAEAQQEGSAPPIPPYVDAPPVMAQEGGYCYEGAHPVDSRVEPGVTWDNTPGRHMHGYPPFDLRLFSFQNGCYYFIGDPTDFGYAGSTYSYYGAHPILANYGGGWCFMIGPHRHFWRPWSPLFATVGPWYYWEGPYDPFFWTYWPFYHHYYRHYYPGYYSHGAFFRGHAVAPRITSVPRPMPRGGVGWHGAGSGMRGGAGAPRHGAGAPGLGRPGVGAPRAPGAAGGGGMPLHRGPGAGFGPRHSSPPAAGGALPNRPLSRPGTGAGFAPRPFSPPARPFSNPATGGGFAPRSFSPPATGGGFAPRSFSPPRATGGGFAPRPFSGPATGGGFAPRSFSPPASGGGFAPRGGFSAPSRPSGGFGGGHFGGGGPGGGFRGGGFGRGGRR